MKQEAEHSRAEAERRIADEEDSNAKQATGGPETVEQDDELENEREDMVVPTEGSDGPDARAAGDTAPRVGGGTMGSDQSGDL